MTPKPYPGLAQTDAKASVIFLLIYGSEEDVLSTPATIHSSEFVFQDIILNETKNESPNEPREKQIKLLRYIDLNYGYSKFDFVVTSCDKTRAN